MTVYRPGQRVVLIHTSDPHTRLRSGATGTVRRHDQLSNTVAIAWDDGSTLAMLLEDGDRVELVSASDSSTPDGPAGDLPASASSHAHTADHPPGTTVNGDAITYVTELPACDLHKATGDTAVLARYDGATRHGPWAFMCDGCFMTHGVGLGLGRGQRLIEGQRPESAAADDRRRG